MTWVQNMIKELVIRYFLQYNEMLQTATTKMRHYISTEYQNKIDYKIDIYSYQIPVCIYFMGLPVAIIDIEQKRAKKSSLLYGSPL